MDLATDLAPLPPTLSAREREVLALGGRGMIDKQVASTLGISLGTVRVYRKRTEAKLGTRGLVQTLLVVWKLGMIDIEPIAQEATERSARRRGEIAARASRAVSDDGVAADTQLT